ncbi:MAG TPA: MarR family winged helix-turn-helix transcriptional regulator [Candidatus Brocadiia bacterium]|nr:MarR family winged helix-turn-helix transcriptional regulator [Candidatus Brocadiia bacterium]
MDNETIAQAQTLQRVFAKLVQYHHKNARRRREKPVITVPQFRALMVIRALEKSSIRDIALALGVSNPSASTMVERLVEMGLLCRVTNPADRRRVEVTLSPLARRRASSIEDKLLSSHAALTKAIGPAATKKWVEVFLEIEQALDSGLAES